MQPIDFYIGIIITNIVVISGWMFSIYLSKTALRRQQRVGALTEAYQVLIQVGIDKGKPGRILGNGEFLDYSRDLGVS